MSSSFCCIKKVFMHFGDPPGKIRNWEVPIRLYRVCSWYEMLCACLPVSREVQCTESAGPWQNTPGASSSPKLCGVLRLGSRSHVCIARMPRTLMLHPERKHKAMGPANNPERLGQIPSHMGSKTKNPCYLRTSLPRPSKQRIKPGSGPPPPPVPRLKPPAFRGNMAPANAGDSKREAAPKRFTCNSRG